MLFINSIKIRQFAKKNERAIINHSELEFQSLQVLLPLFSIQLKDIEKWSVISRLQRNYICSEISFDFRL